MSGIQIKIAGEWLALPEDFSISLEQSNPLFNDQGTFSFPFEIPLEPNRHIFKNVDDPFGYISLADIDKMEAEVWFDGVMLYRGIIETDEEIDFEDSLPVTFLSGNSDFMSRIEGMNAKDVPLDREIKLGYLVYRAESSMNIGAKTKLPDYVMMNFTEYNVSDPYPVKTFCNVRVCTSNEEGYYKVLDAKRPYSGVCFYVMYLIDCLFDYLKISVARNDLDTMEDMCRMAFFTTQCHTKQSEEERVISLSSIRAKDFCGPNFTLKYWRNSTRPGVGDLTVNTEDFTFYGVDVYATNENFPDVTIEDLFNDLKTAFGIRFIYNAYTNSMSILYIKDILRQNNITDLHVDILDATLSRNKNKAIRLTYGEEDDTAFNYNDYSNVMGYDDYQAILDDGVSAYDTVCKIDAQTGNAYRVKVNSSTGGEPSLFEVGGFRDYVQGGNASEEEQNIGFKPVIINAILANSEAEGGTSSGTGSSDSSGSSNNNGSFRPRPGESSSSSLKSNTRSYGDYMRPDSTRPGINKPLSGDTERVYAIFADVELKSATEIDTNLVEGYSYFRRDDVEAQSGGMLTNYLYIRALCPELFDTESNDTPPLRNYDAGYTLGIMRGPGNDSGLETVTEDYDGEGNDIWVQTVGSYAFTSDSCDMFGRFFDYNGTEEGGADQSGRFSLKLVAEKEGYPIGEKYADRGLVNKFLSEYLYFLANRRTVTLTVKMSITQIIGIDFLKKYKIGEFVGFINKISYTLGVNGLEDIQIEMYII